MRTTTWNIDLAHTVIGFSVRHMLVAKVRGRFAKFAGTLRLDESDPSRSVAEVTIDATSIDTGVAERDAHLRSADFFDVEGFPNLHFHNTRIQLLADARYRVVGNLTIRDVTREISLDVEYGGRAKGPWGGEHMGFVARTSVDRRDFGLNWNQVLETGGIVVGDRIEIEVYVEAIRAVARTAA
jgi:polyisoprenoid-binding protein YceI